MKPLLLAINPEYFYKILDWQNQPYQLLGSLAVLPGHDRYNQLIKLNSFFSTFPIGDPVDRTNRFKGPFNFGVTRPWHPVRSNPTIDEVIEIRVKEYLQTNKHINLCWSGGIDSTCFVAGFLKHATHLDQLTLLYSPFSVYENRDFFEFLSRNYPQLKTIDISGDVYIDKNFDGVMVNGHGGDEFTASLDESFFEAVGVENLHKPWQHFITEPSLIEFCNEYFSLAGRPINTLLEARWWFYSTAKSQVFSPRDSLFSTNESSAFFDCQQFEDYMWHNTDKIIPGDGYHTYKQFLKQYIYDFDRNEKYLCEGRKINSVQFSLYTRKKVALLGQQWIATLTDNTVIKTPSLPLFSKLEFEKTYGDSLEYLFNYIER